MQPEIELGPLTLQTFGICFAVGFLAAGMILSRRFKELGARADLAYEMVFAALVGGLVGSRLYYVAQHWDETKDDLLGSLFSGSGLVWYGGAIGGALGVLVWAWRRFRADLVLLDIAAVPLALGYAIGRVGCQVSGDGDYGKPWDGPWAMAYPNGTVATDVPVHPTPIYETLAMGLAAWALWRGRDALKPGLLFACYLVLAGTERFLVEFLRRNDEDVLGLTVAQVESLVLLLVGLAWLAVAQRRGGIRRDAALPARGRPAPA
ncbi:prolipoprotein diacylglyceryl transferase [Conexibacter sp. SYSU D00693]|uniref:prolipoprotein diacylglyceryl transferase n=1 Tax=Conexibacter sp. SYSU D00693 TaxID=2812560 RepID=UPI00196B9C06|nr:prolipoprotein diacylglyceryl transferase [Conexibacter sp. SYSU D00693]